MAINCNSQAVQASKKVRIIDVAAKRMMQASKTVNSIVIEAPATQGLDPFMCVKAQSPVSVQLC